MIADSLFKLFFFFKERQNVEVFGFNKSFFRYMNMCHLVDEMFPPLPEELSDDFSNFIFWREPIPELEMPLIPQAEEGKAATKSKKV